MSDTTSLVPGFPIRTSSDPRSVGSSPRHIAASHVLHRLSMPRHPPCALKHLQTQKPRNKNCKNKQNPRALLARCSQPLSTKQTPHPTTKMERQHTHPTQGRKTGLLSQDPTVCPAPKPKPATRNPERPLVVGDQSCCHFKLSAPPTTHYRRRRKISQPSSSRTVAGTGEHGAP